MTDMNTLLASLSSADALALISQLAAKVDPKAAKDALKKASENKATSLSVTMDAIVRRLLAGQGMVTKDLAADVTKAGKAAGVFTVDEEATHSSVAALVRHAQAFDAAMTRAGYEWSKKTAPVEAPPAETNVTPLPELDPATVEVRKPAKKAA